ncbi:MAG: hypothetical protein PHO32_03330 [Candidatus Cloacimonetes bacterium]|nr:hypothetical protein [Candidatus Cloacimonadota bacterium]
MKVKFKNLLMGYTGKADDSVIYYSPKYGRYIVRRAASYVEEDKHRKFSAVQKAIYSITPSLEFRQDIALYLQGYNRLPAMRDKPIVVWTNLYAKLMWNLQHIYKVDLANITRQQIYDSDLPCQSIARAVEAGLLPHVKGCETLQALL